MLLLTAGTAVVSGLLAGLALVNLSGGLDDLVAGDPPREGDSEVVALREQASADLAAELDRLSRGVIAPALGGDAGVVGRVEVTPPCEKGQHNWKIDHDFDLACRVARLQIVADADRAALGVDMVAVDTALRSDGWSSDVPGMDRVLVDYRRRLDGTTSPDHDARSAMPNDPRGYHVQALPSVQYTKTVDERTRTLAIGWLERGSLTADITSLEAWATFHTVDGRRVEPYTLIEMIPPYGYAIVVTESVEYFRG